MLGEGLGEKNGENVIVMMYVVYVHGGCCDHDAYPWWGNRVVKEF